MSSSRRLATTVLAFALIAGACSDPLAEFGANTTTTTSTSTTTTTTTTEPPPTLPVDPSQPHVAPFDPPGETWPVGTLPPELDGLAVFDLVQRAVQTDRWGPISAVVVAKDGELVAESYRDGYDATSLFPSGTLSAIAVNALIGALVTDQELALYEPWWVSEWSKDERFRINPNLMLRHVSGIETGAALDLTGLDAAAASGSVADHVINQPYDDDLQHAWTEFEFSAGNLAILAQIVEESRVVNGALPRWANERVLTPIGVTSAIFEEDASGVWRGFDGLEMTARDYARLGTLYASNGLWGEQLVLARDWVDFTSLVLEPSTEFGAGLWVDRFGEGTLSAAGDGQRMVIVPAEGLVIAVFSVFASDPVVADFTLELTEAMRTN